MLEVRVIPLLLYNGEGLCKGTRFSDHTYVGDARNAVRIFNAREADEVVLLDINATKEMRCISPDLVRTISQECLMPLTAGGGISSTKDAKLLIAAGAEKIVLNSAAIENRGLVSDVAAILGNQAIVVAIDALKSEDGSYCVFSHNGTRSTSTDPVSFAIEIESAGAGEILLTSIMQDGTRAGYDIELIHRVSSEVRIPVIACGGAGRLEHFKEAVYNGGAAAVAAGSLFVFHGRRRAVLINFPDRAQLRYIFDNP